MVHLGVTKIYRAQNEGNKAKSFIKTEQTNSEDIQKFGVGHKHCSKAVPCIQFMYSFFLKQVFIRSSV